jgi:lysophospholipase L1-like esterase
MAAGNLSPRRRRAFFVLTLATPWLLLGLLELGLRLGWKDGRMPVFDPLTISGQPYLTPGKRLSRRYFPRESMPPVPPTDVFAAAKPARGFRIFVLGESSAAGFPYPHNGTFSRVLRDALHDVLPGDSVEVVNLGIPATNSYTMADIVGDVIAQRPDAVLIYAGHNEYYGALGVGSTIGARSAPWLTRAYLAALRLRTVVLLRAGLQRLVTAVAGTAQRPESNAATFMETVANDESITLGSPAYRAGLRQFDSNLDLLLGRLQHARIPAFIGSIASNVRDQPPFVSPSNGPARAAFDSGRARLAAGDTSVARQLLLRARDLDVVRFRAPSAFNSEIRRLADARGAIYVPVAETFERESPGGIPGHELFLEHVHPNQHGYALIARAFFDAMAARSFLGHPAQLDRLATWREYEDRMDLTPFDRRIVEHAVRTVTTRWPFVDRAHSLDYRLQYRPTGRSDSLALLVSRGGMPWAEAKVLIAHEEAARGRLDSAAAEYRGLVRDAPFLELPNRLLGRTLAEQGRTAEAIPYLETAFRLQPSGETAYLLGSIALDARQLDRAIVLLDQASRLSPASALPPFRLSVAFGLSRNLGAARAAAARAAALDPQLPGIDRWMQTLGMKQP